MKEIQLTQGKVALVDDEDFEYLNQFKWYAIKKGRTFYAVRQIRIDGKQQRQFMHGAILNGKGIDHRDRNGLNNQRNNLRFCNQSENGMNQRKYENTSSIYKGVYFDKYASKWKAQIMLNNKKMHIGLFVLEVDAARAYNAKASELFGEFANLNNV